MRPLLLPACSTPPPTTRRTAASSSACSSRRVRSAQRAPPTTRPPSRAVVTPRRRATTSRALTAGPPAGWRTPGRADFSSRRISSRDCSGRRAPTGGSSPPSSRSCIPAARRGAFEGRGARVPSASSRGGRAGLGAGRRRAAFELDLDVLPGRGRRLPRRDERAGRAPGRGRRGVRGRARRERGGRRAGGWRRPARVAVRLRPLSRRAGGRGPQVAGIAARVPRSRQDTHRRGGGRAARRDRARGREAGSGASVPDGATRVAVLGATGFGGALCAHIVARHPSLELTVVTRAPRRAAATTSSTRATQCRRCSRSSTRTRSRSGPTRRSWPTRTRRPRLAVKQLRERGLKVVDLSADFRLDQAAYERWYQPHEAPELLEEAVYGLPEAHREEIAAASLVAGPGCNSTAALLATLPLGAASRTRSSTSSPACRRGPRGHGGDALRLGGRERERPTRSRATATRPRSISSLGPERFSFVTHLVPIDQGILASCYLTVPAA